MYKEVYPCLQLISISISMIDVFTSFFVPYNYRVSTVIRPFLFVLHIPSLRHSFYNLFLVMPAIADILLLLIITIFLFSWMALALFDSYSGSSYFSNFSQSVWSMIVLLTTSNDPDVYMYYYTYISRFSFIFFLIFLLLTLYFLLPLLLAVIFNTFQKQRDSDFQVRSSRREMSLIAAFCELDEFSSGCLPQACLKLLIQELNQYHDIDYIDSVTANRFFDLLDHDKNG
jgi:hypothetical protein